jgi:hypothetical protein
VKRLGFLFVTLTIASAVWVEAQELRGRLVGSVRDNTGGLLPGVSVTLSGAALISERASVSGSSGNYAFVSVPPGLYDVVFELAGFQTLRGEGVRVHLNVTMTINADMPLAGVQESVTITGETPVVDIKMTTTAVNFTEELLEDIPNARDIL